MIRFSLTAGLSTLITLTLFAPVAQGQVLLVDDFTGSGFVDQTIWRLPSSGPGSFLGRTQLKTNLTTDYPVKSGSGVATLELDTYLNSGGNAFSGHELNTKRNFARAGGLRIEARMRLRDIPPGLVGAFFMFDVQRNNASGNLVRDEYDHEILTKEAQVGGQNRLLKNFWNDKPFTGPGSGGSAVYSEPNIVGGWDMTQFHYYRIDWLADRLEWYVDGQLVRTSFDNVPDDPMTLRLNLWAPAADFSTAYSAALQPASAPGNNVTYGLEIDSVEVTRLNTYESANLLANPSFENAGTWVFFNNALFDQNVFRTGSRSFKTWGPFSGGPNASGAYQDVDVQPGDELEGRVFARSNSSDSIAGASNFATIKIEFLDANGNVLTDNVKESVICDGRDPNFPVNTWIQGTVNAIVPANATKARLVLPIIQLANQGGSVWWDDAELVKLMAYAGDFNNDSVWNCDDIDALVAEIAAGTNDVAFDLTGDGLVTTPADLDAWLAVAGQKNGKTGPYLKGDADLDGDVDFFDLFTWRANQFQPIAEWCSGDFNASGSVDFFDLFAWRTNQFQDVNP